MSTLNEDDFDIKPDFNIDGPPIKSMMNNAAQVDTGPVPNNVVYDLSGLGPLGKIHPNMLLKDKLVRAYHSRMHDPRYAHLRGYGSPGIAPKEAAKQRQKTLANGQHSLGATNMDMSLDGDF